MTPDRTEYHRDYYHAKRKGQPMKRNRVSAAKARMRRYWSAPERHRAAARVSMAVSYWKRRMDAAWPFMPPRA